MIITMRFVGITAALCMIALCFGIYHTNAKDPISFGVFMRDLSAGLFEDTSAPETLPDGIRFVGDIMLARHVEILMNRYGADYPYLQLAKQPDNMYLVGNFEASVPAVHVPTPSMQFQFSVRKEHLPALHTYGFTHLGLSNNHAYDHAAAGFKNSYKELAQIGIVPFGDSMIHASSTVVLLELEGKTVALIPVYAVVKTLTDEEITDMLSFASTVSDYQIAYVHWGTEYDEMHSSFQEILAKRLIASGADAVIGHHPHVIQDIAVYDNAPVFYSLGNFIFDQYFSTAVQQGLVLELSWTEEGNAVYELIPVSSIGSRSAPYEMGAFERASLLDTLAKNSQTGLEEMIQNGRIVLPQ